MTVIGATFCSGIGAPEVAAPWVDWRLASEIEPFAREVLVARHGYNLPADQNQGAPLLAGDMTDVTPEFIRARGLPMPDLIVAGTPCQAFSIAGARRGVEDARGALTLAFVELCHAIQSVRPPGSGLVVLWENVPGVLSDRGNAFGCFVGALVGADAAVVPPGAEWGFVPDVATMLSGPGGAYGWKSISWPGAGMVSGPRARVAWRVLDAQHFGVPQRRRRVFAVVDFGGRVDPAKILFEPRGVSGDFAPGETARQGPARCAVAGASGGQVTVSNGEGCDGVPTLTAASIGRTINNQTPLIAFSSKDFGADAMADLSPTLSAGGASGSHNNAGVPPAIMLQERAGADGGAGPAGAGWRDDDRAFTLEARPVTQSVLDPGAGIVRRITPREAERLQGFADDFTAIPRATGMAADGPRYRALGNSMAVPCVGWILDRLRAELEGAA